ncbi:MAG: hypothetical protein ACYST0_07555, partial [Planctomycetota bacterium]
NGRNIHRGGKDIADDTWGINPDRVVKIERQKRDAIQVALAQYEVPRKYRTQVHDLAKRLAVPIEQPLPPEEDPQLAVALAEIRKLVSEQGR